MVLRTLKKVKTMTQDDWDRAERDQAIMDRLFYGTLITNCVAGAAIICLLLIVIATAASK